MKEEGSARIFLAAGRGLDETDRYRRLSTFGMSGNEPMLMQPLNALYLLNDETLAAGQCLSVMAETTTNFILLPLVGAVEISPPYGSSALVAAGESLAIGIAENGLLSITNPYESGVVNYLLIGIKSAAADKAMPLITAFDLAGHKNGLLPFTTPVFSEGAPTAMNATFLIGQYSGRAEGNYKPRGNAVLVMVVQGAFEVQNRLLETRDALALYDYSQLEFEALSPDAVLLLIEIQVA